MLRHYRKNRLLDARHNERHSNHCRVCDTSFSRAVDLHRHVRTHAAPTHDCPHCNHGFLDARSLRVHVSSRHMSSGQDQERPFLCRLCGKCFRYDFTYDAHMSAHKIPTERRAAALVVLNNGCGKKVMKEFNIKLISEPGQPVTHSVSVDPYSFIERFVELPVCDMGSWMGKSEEDEGGEDKGEEEGEDKGEEDDEGEENEEGDETEESELSDVGATQVFEIIADVTDVDVDTVQHELTADRKAVNIQDEGNEVENTSEKEHETEPVTHRGHVADVCSSIEAATTGVDTHSTARGSASTLARRQTWTKRRLCDLSTNEENVDTCCVNRKFLCYGTSSM